ncbi:menaquinone biosynthesis family protein [Daejeonella oryzae]|uniref:menaquinone biosynthesis family protein n=1 Tax=Daejeonella oryzae TaxID=1122943 RepID=UPI0003FA54FD|nr:1,4-dihydroxy-6-naphthoate synthase [Daejeonella oryzae]
MKLSLGFSPCPNDTFIFDAMIHHKIDTEGLEFDFFFDDVETLNQKALRRELDITKLSFHAYSYVTDHYVLLNSGSALGFGVGPLLISKKEILNPSAEMEKFHIGIPGKYTTANFLLSLAYPEAINKTEMVFSEIENALNQDKIDVGLIIHENRFTYLEKGYKKVKDLGEFWEDLTSCPIPLGGIMIRRDLPEEIKQKVNRIIRRSVEFAFENPKSGLDFIRSHAQEMSEEVMYKHIELYVNKYSIDLGDEGRKAVTVLFEAATTLDIIPKSTKNLFL